MWTDKNKSAAHALAPDVRLLSETVLSIVRVIFVSTSELDNKLSLARFEISSVISFSFSPLADAPGSSPPCPGSISIFVSAAFVLSAKNIKDITKATARNDSCFIKLEILYFLKIKIISLLHFYLVMEFFKN